MQNFIYISYASRLHIPTQQHISSRHFKDVIKQTPRTEVLQFEKYVIRRVEELASDITVAVVGSYIGSQESCGEIGIIGLEINAF